MKKNKRIRIMLLGGLPSPLSGTTVLFQQLVTELKVLDQTDSCIIDTNLVKYKGMTTKMLRAFFTLIKIILNIWRCDVVGLHTTNTRLLLSTIWLHRACKILGIPLIVRKFGGPDHRRCGPDWETINYKYAQKVHDALQKADLYLSETKDAVHVATTEGINHSVWYPNSRPMYEATQDRSRCRRFVYLGHVKPSKGLNEIIQAGECLPEGCCVHIYGPFYDGMCEKDFDGLSRVAYRGIMEPQNINQLLQGYDALVLPTYHKGEGYPGVILEAYSAGLPVIASNWQAIAEIVDYKSGILIQPKDYKALLDAMVNFVTDGYHYQNLCNGVQKSRMQFDSMKWTKYYVDLCRKVAS